MTRKTKKHLLGFILIFFSGNPLASFLFDKFSPSVCLIFTIFLLKSEWEFDFSFKRNVKLIFSIISVIAIAQYIVLPAFSILAIGNLLLKILVGGLIVNYLGKEFPFIFFRIVSKLSLISILGFIFINILNFEFPSIQIGQYFRSYLIYVTLPDEAILRNNGMFWEPGAYAGVLTLCLALNFFNLGKYWQNFRYDMFFIIIALLSTRSTTGYLVGFIIFAFYFFYHRKRHLSILLISLLSIFGFYIFKNNDFLKDKIKNQFDQSKEQRVGELSNTRFGSLIFDWHYVIKHPIIGNGFDLQSRYSDHMYLFAGEQGDVIGSGNAFSNYMATMGVVFVFGYFYLLWELVKVFGRFFSIFFLLIVFLNLQGEQWFNFPIYLGLPFLSLINENGRIIRYSV